MLATECYFLQKGKQNYQHNATGNVSLLTSSPFWHFAQCAQPRKGKFPIDTAAEASSHACRHLLKTNLTSIMFNVSARTAQ